MTTELPIAHVRIAALVRAFGSPWQRQPWGCKLVTRRMVDAALRRPHPVGKEVHSSERRKIGDRWTDAFGLPTHRYHAQRIAWLLTHGWTEPIRLDVGEPDRGLIRYWPLIDGNHRLLAAYYRGAETIRAVFVATNDPEYAERFVVRWEACDGSVTIEPPLAVARR